MSDTNNNINISFRFGGRELNVDGTGRISVKMLRSAYSPTMTDGVELHSRERTNELTHLLHILRRSRYANPTAHVGFDYTLGFPLERGSGFPLVFGYDTLT